GRYRQAKQHTGRVRCAVNLETIADELYSLLPSEFTVARDARARTARRDGNRELAARISGLSRPTLSAWAANILVREHPDDAARFLALGEQLRRAYRELDGDQLRDLARARRQLIQALSRSARDAAAEAGRPISDTAQREVEQTLQAVLSDPESAAQWSAGHLATPLTPPADLTSTGSPADPSRRTRSSGPKRTVKVSDLDTDRDRRRREDEEADEARRAADEAAAEARRADAERAAADGELTRAEDHRRA
ncbi:hypothetical protein N566_27470, partial [Streptomycetaceae bacterium MP113-05]